MGVQIIHRSVSPPPLGEVHMFFKNSVSPPPLGEVRVVRCRTPLPGEPESLSSAPEVGLRHDEEFVALQEGLAKLPIRWPLMKENAAWESFEHAVASQLPPTGSAQLRLKLLQDTIYNEAVKKFGCVKQSAGGSSGKSRRAVKIGGVRDGIKNL